MERPQGKRSRIDGLLGSGQLRTNILHRSRGVIFGLDLLLELPFLRFAKPLYRPFGFLVLIVNRFSLGPVDKLEVTSNTLI